MRLIGATMLLAAAPVASPQAAITAAMTASAAGWNSGDLAKFVAVYADDAIYASGSEVARGKAAIAARYAKSFTKGGNVRGTLSFAPVAWRPLSAVHVLLVARWTLTGGAKEQSGLTTLLFERRGEDWRIISDHSS